MKFETTAAVLALASVSSARSVPLYGLGVARREVPQEHSHNGILAAVNFNLKENNPLQIVDAVFALLGDAAAAGGAPNVQDLDCLQQIVADQAFTNAKAAGNVTGMANAIMFRALERNTGAVGLASVSCNETAVNPEIAAIQQHQDPASTAAAGNKQIALDVAKQLQSIGADPNLAIQTGTFAPGTIGDPTARGNTCDVVDDAQGCIITQNLLVPDVTEAEIAAAVGSGSTTSTGSTAAATSADTTTTAVAAAATTAAAAMASTEAAATATSDSAAGVNVQTFTGTLGGAPPPVISSCADAARPFSVDGDTFVNAGAALQRSCSIQHNACADAVNSGQLAGAVSQCDDQDNECNAAAGSGASRRAARRDSLRQRGDACTAATAATTSTAAAATTTSSSTSSGSSTSSSSTTTTSSSSTGDGSLDFGSCSDPAIEFVNGLDGRTQPAFAPVNSADFVHGSALNIAVIADFICTQLNSPCQASAATLSACDAAASAASALTGQDAADSWNSALGVSA